MHLVEIELHIVMLLFFIVAINLYGGLFEMKMNESRRFFLFLLTLSLFLTPVYSTVPKSPATKSPMLPFTDINQHWATDAITRAFEKNIVLGYGDGTFRPDNPVSSIEFTTMLTRSGALHAGDGVDPKSYTCDTIMLSQ